MQRFPLDGVLVFLFFLFFLPPSLLVNTPVSSQHHKTLGISWCFVAFPLALLAFLALCCQAGHPNADLLGIELARPDSARERHKPHP